MDEQDFMDAYKRLEKILREKFCCDSPVLEYEHRMEKCSAHECKVTDDWNYIYEQLDHVRKIRNSIAHDAISMEFNEDDLQFIDEFYDMLLEATDPLALVYKQQEKEKEQFHALNAKLAKKIKQQEKENIKEKEMVSVLANNPADNEPSRNFSHHFGLPGVLPVFLLFIIFFILFYFGLSFIIA